MTIRKQLEAAHTLSGGQTDVTFLVEVIRDMQELKKGLSDRESMHEDHGVLFVLNASQENAFWMKDMRFPLDIIFIGGTMQIIEILENLQPCKQCPVYFPKKRPTFALEINAGLTRRYGLSVGDTMVFESIEQGSDGRIGRERGLDKGKGKGRGRDKETEGETDTGKENRMPLPLPAVSSSLSLPAFPSCLTSVSNSTFTSLWSAAHD